MCRWIFEIFISDLMVAYVKQDIEDSFAGFKS